MTGIEMLKSANEDINALILQGMVNWKRAASAIAKINAVISEMAKAEEAEKKAHDEAIEEARRQREQVKQEAAERGEEILGGETIEINLLSGEQKTVIE